VIDLPLTDPAGLTIIFAGLMLGGILKGATGAGLPVIAVPTIAAFYDVRFAVVLLVIPNFTTNAWQIYKYRTHNAEGGFIVRFALYGALGAAIGTVLLAYLSSTLLSVYLVGVVLTYIGLRIFRPNFHISMKFASNWAWLAGISGGAVQGSLGLSAPIVITFLHATRLKRPEFILAASTFFATMSVVQLPGQIVFGLMSIPMATLSLLTIIPILIGLPIGERLGKKMSPATFDQAIIMLLVVVAIKQIVNLIA